MAQSYSDVKGKFKAREKSVQLVTDGELLAELEAAQAELAAAARAVRSSLDDGIPTHVLAERVRELEQQVAESVVTFRFRGLGRNAYRRLQAEHKPTEDDELFNPETFTPALLAACSLDPVLTVDDVLDLFDALTEGQADQLTRAAYLACTSVDDVPFRQTASGSPPS